MKFKELVSSFLSSNDFKALKKNTKKVYVRCLTDLADKAGEVDLAAFSPPVVEIGERKNSGFFANKQGLERLTGNHMQNGVVITMPTAVAMRSDVAMWRGFIEASFAPATTRNLARVALMRLYVYGDTIGAVRREWLQGLKGWRHRLQKADAFNESEIAKALDVAFPDRVYQLVLAFMFWTGLRTSEIVELREEHLAEGFIVIKGNKRTEEGEIDRKVFLCDEAVKVLVELRGLKRPNLKLGWVFTNRLGRKLSRQSVSDSLKKILQKAGVSHRKLYCARHGFAVNMLREGYTVDAIAATMGNSPEVVRMHYLTPTVNDKAEYFKGFKRK